MPAPAMDSPMISLADYWMGRDLVYPRALTHEMIQNAQLLVDRVNLLLARAEEDCVSPAQDERTGTWVASGWRPPAVNDRTSNAANASTHLVGLGVDLQDWPDRRLARWCLRHPEHLEEAGLWMEDPRWTPDWVHLQARPPGSGRRVYVPSAAPALAAALPEQRVA